MPPSPSRAGQQEHRGQYGRDQRPLVPQDREEPRSDAVERVDQRLVDLDLPVFAQALHEGAEQAILALLCGKLLGQRRISHISDLCNDEGAGLFADLNVLPKATFATDYSYRTERPMSDRFW